MKKYRNYFILLMLTLITFYMAWWVLAQYKISKDYAKNISTLSDIVAYSLKPEEISPYLKENREVYMIVTNTHDKNAAKFEKNMTAVINKYGINSNIVLYNISEKPEVLFTVLETFNKTKILPAPAVYYYREGVLIDAVNEKNNKIANEYLQLKKNNKNDKSLSQQDITNFLKNYWLID